MNLQPSCHTPTYSSSGSERAESSGHTCWHTNPPAVNGGCGGGSAGDHSMDAMAAVVVLQPVVALPATTAAGGAATTADTEPPTDTSSCQLLGCGKAAAGMACCGTPVAGAAAALGLVLCRGGPVDKRAGDTSWLLRINQQATGLEQPGTPIGQEAAIPMRGSCSSGSSGGDAAGSMC